MSGNSSSGASGKSSKSSGSGSNGTGGKLVKVSPSRPGRASVVLGPLAAAAAAAAALNSEGSSDDDDGELQDKKALNHDQEQLSFSTQKSNLEGPEGLPDESSSTRVPLTADAISTAETMMAKTTITSAEDSVSGAISSGGEAPSISGGGHNGRSPGRGRPNAPRKATVALRSDKSSSTGPSKT